jgi:hypothetical protein
MKFYLKWLLAGRFFFVAHLALAAKGKEWAGWHSLLRYNKKGDSIG